ncbi:MAG: C25 family cysteine peptidase [bacterium]
MLMRHSVLTCTVAFVLFFAGIAGAAVESLSVPVPIGEYTIKQVADGDRLYLEDFGRLLVAGKPKLPSKIFAVAIPPGARLIDLSFTTGAGIELPGTYNLEPTPLPRVIGDEDPGIYAAELARYEANYRAVYDSDDAYPQQPVVLERTAGYRSYNLVDVRVTPFAYQPKSGRVTFYPDITINLTYDTNADSRVIGDNLESTEQIAKRLVLNYEQASTWQPLLGPTRGLHDLVIITLESLVDAVQPLVDWETAKGRNVEVVTTNWIGSNYTGYDLAAKMRAFLRDKFPAEQWGIEDVLLVGDYDDVPMRRCAQDLGYGQPETDFYFAELSLPDSESWDDDGDHQYGENGDDIDFYAEVNVGRIPYSAVATVTSICEKSVAFEQNTDPAFKKNILLLGGYFWADTDNAVMMEYKTNPAMHEWMADWTMTRLYEQNSGYYSNYPCDYPLLQSNVMTVWPNGTFAFVNWAGHGSPYSAHIAGLGAPAFIESSDCPSLNDDYPAIIFADACSNSDTDDPNIGRAMLGQGGVGFVGATKVALGCPGWQDHLDGSSQSLDYFFTTAVTSGEYTQGAALQYALQQMYSLGLWDYDKYETFEWGALWGSPNLCMTTTTQAMQIEMIGTPPECIMPESTCVMQAQIILGSDTYLDGSAKLRYRLDGGRYETVLMSDLGGNLFEAVLPAALCEDTFEFYFSANGENSGTVYSPITGPSTPYASLVGELAPQFVDHFELDQGWMVQSDPTLMDGAWERGIPVGGGDRGDPAADFDGSGQCYLTCNQDGDSDVDGGATSLLSPVFSMATGDGVISYARWYSNSSGSNPYSDALQVYISNSGGTYWTLVETVGPVLQASGGWFEHSFWVGDFLTPTSQMRLKVVASDAGSDATVEAAFDDFKVTLFQCIGPYICGDADSDEIINIADVVHVVSYIFAGGPPPLPMPSGDVNCDGTVNVVDAVYLVAYIFGGGPAPADPNGDGVQDC